MPKKKNYWSWEIGVKIIKAERTSFALLQFSKSKILLNKTKIRLYTVTMRATSIHGCEVWTTTTETKQRLTTFENKIWWMISGPKLDTNIGI